MRMRLSLSSILASSAAFNSSGVCAVRSASSALLRSRVSGVLRSCAMLSETSRMPAHQFADAVEHGVEVLRQAIEFVAAAGRRGSRPLRSPAMMVRVVSVMSSTRFRTRRVMNQPPAQPSTPMKRSE